MVKDKIKINGFWYIRKYPLKKKIREAINMLNDISEHDDKDDIDSLILQAKEILKEVIK